MFISGELKTNTSRPYGWFISWKILSQNGWCWDTTILGNLQLDGIKYYTVTTLINYDLPFVSHFRCHLCWTFFTTFYRPSPIARKKPRLRRRPGLSFSLKQSRRRAAAAWRSPSGVAWGMVGVFHGGSPKMAGWLIHWIGLRENLQETMVFTIKYRAFL